MTFAPRLAKFPRVPRQLRPATLFFGCFVVFAMTATYSVRTSTDVVATLTPAWQLATHGNLTLDHFRGLDPWFVESHGRVVSNRMPGAIFFATPFYWLLGRGSQYPTYFPAGIASAFAAAVAVTLVYLLVRRIAAERVALAASLLLAFGTATWTVSGHALWTHGPNQLWIAAALLLAARGVPLAAGLAFGAGVFTRPYTAIMAAVFGLLEGAQRRSLRWVVKIGVGAAVGLLALLAYNHHMFSGGGAGQALRGGYPSYATKPSGVGLTGFTTNWLGALISPERGIFVLSPALLLLLPGLPAAWRAAPTWARSAALGGLAYMAAELQRNSFSGQSGFFSYRLAIEWVTASVPLLVLAWTHWTSQTAGRRKTFVALALVSTAFHAIGAVTPPQGGLTDPWRTFDVAWAVQHYPLRSIAAVLAVAAGGVVLTRLMRRSGATPKINPLAATVTP